MDSHLNGRFVHHLLEIEGDGLHSPAVTVDVSDQVGDAAVEEVGALDIALAPVGMPRAGERDLQALVQIGDLFEVGDQQIEIVFDDREYLWVGLEGHGGAVIRRLFALHQTGGGFPPAVLLTVLPALAADLRAQFFGQSVHHRTAHTVKAAGDLVGPTAELAARVQGGHHRFQGAFAGFSVLVDGDSTAVVGHGYPAVFGNGNIDVVAVAGHCFVHRVIQYLVDQVVQATLVGAADVHPGADTHRLHALQHLDVLRCVIA